MAVPMENNVSAKEANKPSCIKKQLLQKQAVHSIICQLDLILTLWQNELWDPFRHRVSAKSVVKNDGVDVIST